MGRHLGSIRPGLTPETSCVDTPQKHSRADDSRIETMDGTDAVAWGSLAAAGLSAVAAVGAWRAARKAGSAAEALTSVEASRRHDELTPQFSLRVGLLNPGGTIAALVLELDGPIPLKGLESL